MRLIAAVNVNLDDSPLGTRSRLRESLDGTTILRRTIERVRRVRGIESVYVLVPPTQADEVRSLVAALDVQVETHDAPPPPYRDLVRTGRFWNLDGWRGGPGSLCAFDEDFNAALLQGLAAKTRADAVVSIPAAAPLLDADLVSNMIDHFQANIELSRMTIVQAPPGLHAFVLARDVIDQLLPIGMPPGAMLVYQPNSPAPDLTGREACYRPDASIVRAAGRLLCDTQRSCDRVRRLLDEGAEHWSAETICRWLTDNERRHVCATPEEIEIELTTDDQFDHSNRHHPRGDAVPPRGPIDMSMIDRIADAIAGTDDTRVVLGGFGEPTLHPHFRDICRRLRDAGAAAICIRTNAIAAPGDAEAAMFETPVDIVEVIVDAANVETYRRVHGIDAFDKVTATIDRWCAMRTERQSVRPMIVPSLVKSTETLNDLEPFVDHFQRKLGAYVVRGSSHYAGQRSRLAVTSMSPPQRDACHRVFSRMMVLANGAVTTCDQDYAARQTLGNIGDTALAALWRHERLAALRRCDNEAGPLCPQCDEWHRP